MRALFRLLLPPLPIANKPAVVQREQIVMQLNDGSSITLLRVRDPRARRIKLNINKHGARLTLPVRSSLQAGERFLREHQHWLRQELNKHQYLVEQTCQQDITTRLPLRGEYLQVHWEHARTPRIERTENGLVFFAPSNAKPATLQRVLKDFYTAEARADVGRWLPHYLADLPRPPRRIVFKQTSSLWGSLAPDDTLALDLSLILAVPAAFEYVLVHELCHLMHRNHSAQFWQAVHARYPEWKQQRDYLRSEGRQLKGQLLQLFCK